MRLGLGTGSTAAFMMRRLGARVRAEGLRVTGVPTSTPHRRAARARRGSRWFPSTIRRGSTSTIDGADEADGSLNLIKGGGGALLHEKIVAAASDRMVVIADAGKAVDRLGAFPLPVEVSRSGRARQRRAMRAALDALGHEGRRDRNRAGRAETPFRTDEGNLILDCHLEAIGDPAGARRGAARDSRRGGDGAVPGAGRYARAGASGRIGRDPRRARLKRRRTGRMTAWPLTTIFS